MDRPLDTLTIKGFKSIHALEGFRLRPLNALIGGNGAGKSNFIEFFRLLNAMMKPDGLKEFVAGNADAYLYGGPKTTAAVQVAMRFGDNGYDFELAPTEDGRFLVNNEKACYLPLNTTRNLGSGNFDPALLAARNEPAYSDPNRPGTSWHTYQAIASWTVYHFHDTSPQAGMRRYHDQGHNEKLFADAANIAPYLLALKQSRPSAYGEILNATRLVIPFLDDFILQPNGNEMLRLDWRQKGLADYPLRPSQLSDGAMRFICLATALLQPEPPSMIVIDEPELGLHPQAIAVLAELLTAATGRAQVVVATQSAALINHFSIGDIILVNREGGRSTFTRPKAADFSEWLKDYSVGELWAKNVLAGGPVHE